jgi:hypothetical protein
VSLSGRGLPVPRCPFEKFDPSLEPEFASARPKRNEFEERPSGIIGTGRFPGQQEATMTNSTTRILAGAAIAATAILGAAMAKAAPAYDGNWSVLIVTQKGDCDRGYRYPVKITNGVVGYAGQASFNVAGKVAGNGAITVTVSRGDKYARGSGTLSGNSGGGQWKTGSGECSGTWTAERRS